MRNLLPDIRIIDCLKQSQAGKGPILVFLLVALILVFCESACVTSFKPAIPQKNMLLIIDSFPTGASVFSYKDGSMGSLIGKTPLEIPIGASMDYDGKNYYFWFYSPHDIITAKKKKRVRENIYDLNLNCVIIKDGFQAKYVTEQYVTSCVGRYGIEFLDQKQMLHFALEKDDEPKPETQQQLPVDMQKEGKYSLPKVGPIP